MDTNLIDKIAELTCPKCKKDSLKRGVGGGVGLAFKGSGFYSTDYPSGDKNSSENTDSQSPKKSSCCPCGKPKCTD